MARSKSPAIRKRWKTSIDHDRKLKSERLEEEKQNLQEQVNRDALQALRRNNNISRPLGSTRPSQTQTSINRDDRKNVGKERLEEDVTEAGQSAPLPTPPNSPTASKITKFQLDEVDHHNAEECRNHIGELEASIDLLKSTAEEYQAECQRLREERSETSRSRVDAIRRDDEEEIKRLKKREERLSEMIKEKEETIESLEKELVETKKSKCHLEIQLADVEYIVQERDRALKGLQDATSVREVMTRKSPTVQIDQGSNRRQESMLQGKDWAIYCSKGRKKSGMSIAREVVKHSSKKP